MPSPAERYAAARTRARREGSELRRFTDGLDFPLDEFQQTACEAVEEGKGVLVAAPTGAGKTIVGEFAVHLALATGRKAFYTTPIKALSNQKYHDLVRRHGGENVGLLTGDSSVNGEAPVVVMTTEVLRNMMYGGSSTLHGLGLRRHGRGPLPRRPVPRGGVGGGHHPPARVGAGGVAVGHGEQRRGVRRLAGRGARQPRGRRLRAPAGAALAAHARRHDDVRPLRGRTGSTPTSLHAIRNAEQRGRVEDDGPPRLRPWRPAARPAARWPRARRRRRRVPRWPRQWRRHGGGPGGGDGGRGFARGGRPGGGATRAEVIEELDRDGLLPAITFIFSRVGCEASVGQLLAAGTRLIPEREGLRIRRHVEERVESLAEEDLGGPGLLGLRRRAVARLRGTPRRDAAAVPRDRRGAVHRGADPGRVRHRDAGAGHQHAGAHRRPREAREVQRRGARRRHPGRVHPAHRPGRAARHRHRGPRGRPVGPRGRPARRRRARVDPHLPPALELPADVQHGGQPRVPGRARGGARHPRDLLRPVPGRPGGRRHRDRRAAQRGGPRGLRRGDALPPRGLPAVRRPAPTARRRREGGREVAVGVAPGRGGRRHGEPQGRRRHPDPRRATRGLGRRRPAGPRRPRVPPPVRPSSPRTSSSAG